MVVVVVVVDKRSSEILVQLRREQLLVDESHWLHKCFYYHGLDLELPTSHKKFGLKETLRLSQYFLPCGITSDGTGYFTTQIQPFTNLYFNLSISLQSSYN